MPEPSLEALRGAAARERMARFNIQLHTARPDADDTETLTYAEVKAIALGGETVLDDATLDAMRAQAVADAGPNQFVDPALIREAQFVMPRTNQAWLERVVGHTVPAWRYLPYPELLLAVRAAKADAVHLQAAADAQRAEWQRANWEASEASRAADKAIVDAWADLRSRLPVPVEVWHNWTSRHVDGYEQGADHIVVREPLTVGRFHRDANRPLCWTPSRDHELRHVFGNTGDETRTPDCKACLRRAHQLATLEA